MCFKGPSIYYVTQKMGKIRPSSALVTHTTIDSDILHTQKLSRVQQAPYPLPLCDVLYGWLLTMLGSSLFRSLLCEILLRRFQWTGDFLTRCETNAQKREVLHCYFCYRNE